MYVRGDNLRMIATDQKALFEYPFSEISNYSMHIAGNTGRADGRATRCGIAHADVSFCMHQLGYQRST